MTTLPDLVDIGRKDSFLAIVSTVRADGSPQASLVNAGILTHPVNGRQVVGFVTYGPVKLKNLRERPQVSVSSGPAGPGAASTAMRS